jgi:DNA-binding response OmpR family regulator
MVLARAVALLATSRCVLVVEDDLMIQGVVAEYLRDEGFDVVVANNGADGLRLARQEAPDLAVVDVFMPVMDGREMLVALKRDPRLSRMPIIILSAAADLASLARQFEVRATLAKPFDLNVLGAIVEQTLAR